MRAKIRKKWPKNAALGCLRFTAGSPVRRFWPRKPEPKRLYAWTCPIFRSRTAGTASRSAPGSRLFGNFGYTSDASVQVYAHTNYASKKVTGGFFFRNPNTRGSVFSADGGKTLLIGDVLAANGTGSANCPTVAITNNVADPVALQQVFDDPNCFSFRELFPGGFTPSFGGKAQDMSVVGGVRGFTAGGFNSDVSASFGAHETDLFIRNTVNASLGPDTPTAFNLGSNRQRAVGLNADFSFAATEMINIAAGVEWRNEQYETQGRRSVISKAASLWAALNKVLHFCELELGTPNSVYQPLNNARRCPSGPVHHGRDRW